MPGVSSLFGVIECNALKCVCFCLYKTLYKNFYFL